MGKIQTRRSISIRGDTYDRLRAWCEERSESMSEIVERLLEGHIGPGHGYRPLPSVGVAAVAKRRIDRQRVQDPRPSVAAAQTPPVPPPLLLPPPVETTPQPPTPTAARLVVPAGALLVGPVDSYRPIRSAAAHPVRGNLGVPSPLPEGVRVHRDTPPEDITDHRQLRF